MYNGVELMAPSYWWWFGTLESISACIYNGLGLTAPPRINICLYIQWFGAHGAIILWAALELANHCPLVCTMVWSSWGHHIDNHLEPSNQYLLVYTMVGSSWRHHILNCFGARESLSAFYLQWFGAHGAIILIIIWSPKINIRLYIQWIGAHGAIIFWTALELANHHPLLFTMVWSSWRHHIDNGSEP